MTPPPRSAVAFSDGACRGNPGPAGAGWVLQDTLGGVFAEGTKYLGRTTNNVAEYAAAILALEDALARGVTTVRLCCDSELLVRQVSGRYQVRNAGILPLYQRLCALRGEFASFAIRHVPRAQNAAADAQANLAIDAEMR